jgi:hypothetical protein
LAARGKAAAFAFEFREDAIIALFLQRVELLA